MKYIELLVDLINSNKKDGNKYLQIVMSVVVSLLMVLLYKNFLTEKELEFIFSNAVKVLSQQNTDI